MGPRSRSYAWHSRPRARSRSATSQRRAAGPRPDMNNPFRNHNAAKPINLALQGGGAHGAFTWGVLDRLLEDERIEIEAISGTSAGAMNAVALISEIGRA